MVSLEVRVRFRAPPDRVFALVSDHERFFTGFPVRSVRLSQAGLSDRNGLGAVREICGTGICFVEEIVLFEPGVAYEYRVRKINIPARHEFGRLDFLPCAEGTEVVWRTRYAILTPVAGPVLSRLAAPVFRSLFTTLLQRARTRLGA